MSEVPSPASPAPQAPAEPEPELQTAEEFLAEVSAQDGRIFRMIQAPRVFIVTTNEALAGSLLRRGAKSFLPAHLVPEDLAPTRRVSPHRSRWRRGVGHRDRRYARHRGLALGSSRRVPQWGAALMETIALDISQYLDSVRRPWTVPIEHLSATSLGMLARCPEQFRQRYVLGRKERPGEALVIGTAVHLAAEQNFAQKIETHEDLPVTELLMWYDDIGFPQAIEERVDEDIVWDTDPDGARQRGRAITSAYRMAVAPRVQPLATETRVEADFGLAIPVIGYADVRTTEKIIDIKTGNKSRRQIKPEWRIQAGVYSTITELPVDFHCVSATATNHRATVNTPLEAPELSIWLPPEAREETKRNVRVMAGMAQSFMDAIGPDEPWPTLGQVHPWACGYCGFRAGCPAWRGIDS